MGTRYCCVILISLAGFIDYEMKGQPKIIHLKKVHRYLDFLLSHIGSKKVIIVSYVTKYSHLMTHII